MNRFITNKRPYLKDFIEESTKVRIYQTSAVGKTEDLLSLCKKHNLYHSLFRCPECDYKKQ